jgi:hypothetical protein
MSTPPRDAGIPMLTEVIEVIDEAEMDFVGPPAPEHIPAEARPANEPAPAVPEAPAVNAAPPSAATGYLQPTAGRHYGTPTTSLSPFGPAYPIPLKPAGPAVSAPPPSAPQRPAPPLQASGGTEPPHLSEEEWHRMERRVRERILGQLLSRTDAVLEERIRNSLAGVLQDAVDGLTATLRENLHKTLEDVVSRAVAQEITRLQASKNKTF